MLALCTALVSVFMVKGITHKKFVTTVLGQEQLMQCALSAPALAQSFLYFSADELKEVEQKSNTAAASGKNASVNQDTGFGKLLLEKVLPVVNKTQKFNLREVDKSFPVVVNLTFFCESGKININSLYDLVQKKFYDEGVPGKDQKVFATWLFDKIAVLTEKPSLLQPFVEHVKQRTTPFNDVTELLSIKEFAACFSQAVFYDENLFGKRIDKKLQKVFLTDLFTVASENDTIQPWLLSPSVCALLDIAQKSDEHEVSGIKEEKKVDTSSFKQQGDWQKDWNACFKQLYGITYDKIPEPVRLMLSPSFSVTVFSILVTVAQESVEGEKNRMVRIFAILKQKKLPNNSLTYDVIKIYQV